MEEGEIATGPEAVPGAVYDPAYEWPGESSNIWNDGHSIYDDDWRQDSSSYRDEPLYHDSPDECTPGPDTLSPSYPAGPSTSKTKSSSTFPMTRLVVLQTSILPKLRTLALIDGYPEVQLGRDIAPTGSSVPRVRLKEMEVSKLHATVFWDKGRKEWAVVDMGSKHGTFVKPSGSEGAESRLSPPRVASVPRRLRHLDQLKVGSTTFQVHIHDDQVPCMECSPTATGNEIPLFNKYGQAREKVSSLQKRTRDVTNDVQLPRDPKRALNMLKHNLLPKHGDRVSAQSKGGSYLDRSARRRALFPESYTSTPAHYGTPSSSESASSSPAPSRAPQTPSEILQAPKPLSATNIGHRLLMKQGWQPGTALGSSVDLSSADRGLVEPLKVSASQHRSGLGVKASSLPNIDSDGWREAGKQNRWKDYGT